MRGTAEERRRFEVVAGDHDVCSLAACSETYLGGAGATNDCAIGARPGTIALEIAVVAIRLVSVWLPVLLAVARRDRSKRLSSEEGESAQGGGAGEFHGGRRLFCNVVGG